jgi:hypothetical protein
MRLLPCVADVNGLGKLVEATGDFHDELRQLKSAGAKLISPRDEAYARLQTRGKENIGYSGTRTSAGFESTKGKYPLFRADSRLNNPSLAKLAVKWVTFPSLFKVSSRFFIKERPGVKSIDYFHTPSTREYEESAAIAGNEARKGLEPQDRSVIVLPSRETFTMDDKQNWDIYQFALKDQAKPYFEFNGPITIFLYSAKTVDDLDGTLLTQLWFDELADKSDFDGNGVNLYAKSHDDMARGILNR